MSWGQEKTLPLLTARGQTRPPPGAPPSPLQIGSATAGHPGPANQPPRPRERSQSERLSGSRFRRTRTRCAEGSASVPASPHAGPTRRAAPQPQLAQVQLMSPAPEGLGSLHGGRQRPCGWWFATKTTFSHWRPLGLRVVERPPQMPPPRWNLARKPHRDSGLLSTHGSIPPTPPPPHPHPPVCVVALWQRQARHGASAGEVHGCTRPGLEAAVTDARRFRQTAESLCPGDPVIGPHLIPATPQWFRSTNLCATYLQPEMPRQVPERR